jgi:hypothetical protein
MLTTNVKRCCMVMYKIGLAHGSAAAVCTSPYRVAAAAAASTAVLQLVTLLAAGVAVDA